ncbi:1475_t:CDS:10 [Ambispora leptoticha]|uniref:1475_t:CDS:1 n=1 Tax=Ambispora leptoticha TaxID=144679 RepID=A0A9N8VLL9_9GLOM|nr:1475_t:CDS:10 [Ambispora leptoticha]
MAEREITDDKASASKGNKGEKINDKVSSSHEEKESKINTSQNTLEIDIAVDSTAVIQKSANLKEISGVHEEATTAAKIKSDIKKPARGRGRPKKVNGIEVTTATNIINDTDQYEQAKEIIPIRRPGRPKKIKGDEVNSQISEFKTITNEADQSSKPRRGRPKKKIDPNLETAPSSNKREQKESETASEFVKEVRKSEGRRGRRRKFNEIERETPQDPMPIHTEITRDLNQQDLDIRIPDVLKAKLVDDWEYVMKLNNYIQAPSSVTINQILDRWMTYQRLEDLSINNTSNIGEEVAENNQNLSLADNVMPLSDTNDIYHRVVAGLKNNFECAVNYDLLYNVEKPYLVDLKKNHADMELCDVYGAEHLLRLIVKLPYYLMCSDIDYESLQELKVRCDQIMTFLVKNVDEFFLPSPAVLNTATASSPVKKQRNNMNNNNIKHRDVKCANCKITSTAVWRVGPTQDQTLCNACGLYYNKNKQHRPERLWKH